MVHDQVDDYFSSAAVEDMEDVPDELVYALLLCLL